jgi:protein LSM12
MATTNGRDASSKTGQRLADVYPVNTLFEMTLSNDEVVTGRIYCTDEFSQSVVIQKPLAHTTLASELRIIHAASIRQATKQDEPVGALDSSVPLSKPLPKIQKKTLEERERKAYRQAEESFRHINQKVRFVHNHVAMTDSLVLVLFTSIELTIFFPYLRKASPRGQACFDRLLKACNEVVWKDESILVLNQIQVDPPYTAESCTIIQRNSSKKTLEDGSLERVRKIVAAETATS